MNERQSKILKLLHKNQDYVTYSEIALQTDVSVKTVRNDVGEIKNYLGGAGEIISKPHAGIKLVISEDEWNNLHSGEDFEEKEISFFIIRSLFKSGTLTAQKLAEKYYLGRVQLDKILDRISDWFFENHIVFERKRGKGISIKYSEFNYRLAFLNFLSDYTSYFEKLVNAGNSKNSFLSSSDYAAISGALNGFEPDKVSAAIVETEQQFGIKFNYVSGMNLTFSVSLCIQRIRAGCRLQMPNISECPAHGQSGKLFAKVLCEKLESDYGIKFSESEKEFIAFSADISEIREFESEAARRRFEAMNIDLCRTTVRAVNLVSEITGVNLREDKFFVKQMFIQFKATVSRLEYGVICKNRLLPEIKDKYPNMMAVAWFLGNIFEKELNLELNEHEVGFIALHIGGAIERQLSLMSACIVCDYGIGISQILKEKILRFVPGIRITSVFSGRDIHAVKNENCDFIITTTPLTDYRLNRDVITVGHLLDERDIKLLEDYMRKLRLKKSGRVNDINPKATLFNKELIFLSCDIQDKNELLHMICSRLEQLGYVTQEFETSVIEREASTPTDIGKGIAVPHGLSSFVNHSAAVFAHLNTPIEWSEDGETVDLIFLLAFDLDENPEVKEKIIGFYKSVVSFTEDEAAYNKIKQTTSSDEIMKIFELW